MQTEIILQSSGRLPTPNNLVGGNRYQRFKMQNTTAAKQVLKKSNISQTGHVAFSLIEVLVAIAILTIGILAILILFPAGVSSLQTAAEISDATRLGQAELERADASQTQLIAAIYPNSAMGANVNPASMLVTHPEVTTPLNQNTDVDGYRFIEGETVRAPSPVIDVNDPNSNPVSLYTVVANPIAIGSSTPLAIYGTPWQGISGDLSGSLSDPDANSASDLIAGQPMYLIDYNRGEILLAPESLPAGGSAYPEEIQFTVTIPAAEASVGTVVSLSSLALTNGNGNGQTPLTPWVVGSDQLTRNFNQVGTSYSYSNFNSDPYEWQFYSPPNGNGVTLGTSGDPASLGVIAFNPLGAQVHGINGKPLEAMINYYTYDWHIISEDRSVTSPLGAVKLSLVSLLASTASDKLSDNSTPFTGLFTYSGAPTGTDNPDFMVLDMDKGDLLTESTNGTSGDYTVNYPNGTVTFINPNGTYVNDHLRIFYHPAKDWAVSLSRAPLIYSADPTPNSTAPGLAQYSLSADGTTMYFPLADVGKQVDIRFTYTPTNGTATTSENLYTIASPNGVAEVTLPVTSGSQETNITVKGVSFSALVIWKENGIWRNQTVSTLVQGPTVPASTTLQ
jgi:type II secretory pathway pseudopilin PulG